MAGGVVNPVQAAEDEANADVADALIDGAFSECILFLIVLCWNMTLGTENLQRAVLEREYAKLRIGAFNKANAVALQLHNMVLVI